MITVLDVSGSVEILLQKEKKKTFDKIYKKASWVIAPDLGTDNANSKNLAKYIKFPSTFILFLCDLRVLCGEFLTF